MKIIIKTKNIENSESLNSYIEEKLSGLQKFISVLREEGDVGKTLAEVFVEIEKTTKHHRKGEIFMVKAFINMPGRNIVTEVESDDLFKAVIEAKDNLQAEIRKYKTKNIDKNRRAQMKVSHTPKI